MSVTTIAYHEGKNSDLKDNKAFLNILEEQRARSIDEQEVENNYGNQMILFKRNTFYQIFFTVETGTGIDAYITHGKTAQDCIAYAEAKRNLQSEYLKELLNKVTI